MKTNSLARTLLGMLAITALGACGAAEDSGSEPPFEVENVAELDEALGISECDTAPIGQSFTGKILFTSPRTYSDSGCTKAKVLGLVNPLRNVVLRWEDSGPTEAECSDSYLKVIGYRKSGSSFINSHYEHKFGVWDDFLGCLFNVPPLSFDATKSYKLAVTARNPANATRKFHLETVLP